MSESKRPRWGVFLLVILAVWLAGVTTASAAGLFQLKGLPLLLGLAAVVPVVVFLLWFYNSDRLRTFLLGLNPAMLAAVHTWRIVGVVFLTLMALGMLPPSFALPAGMGDIAMGVTAPWIARMVRRQSISPGEFIAWQVAGIADLVIAVGTGVLSSPTKMGILAHGVTTRLMGQLPLSLIPTFFVPLLVILHIIQIAQARSGVIPSPLQMPTGERLETRYIG